MNETRKTRMWSWAIIAIGIAAMMMGPVLYLTAWSRATGVVSFILGAIITLIGILVPLLGRRARIALLVVVAVILCACAAAGIWTWILVQAPNIGA